MRVFLALLVLYGAACGGDDDDATCEWDGQTYELGDVFPRGDGCNTCSCEPDGISCTLIACEPDAGPATCLPTTGCAVGPMCGGVCCDTGEHCLEGVCRCGENPACAPGDSCEAFGPIGGDACGAVCCGVSGPCPQ